MPGFVPRNPLRIPAKYRMYNARMRWPDASRIHEMTVMAPNERMARAYFHRRHPEISELELSEMQGPFYPSEERQMNPRGWRSAYEREVAKRRNELIDDYRLSMDAGEVEPFSDEELFNYYDRQARYEIDDWLNFKQDYRRPVKEFRPFTRIKDARSTPEYAFDLDGVVDRLRMRGVPEEEIGTIIDTKYGRSNMK